MLRILILITIIVTSQLLHGAIGKEVYTEEETRALQQFLPLVKDSLYLDYQRTNAYLISWLRNKNLDLAKAKDALETSLRYRQENNIDGIPDDPEMLKVRKQYPVTLGEAIDKVGDPAYQVTFSSWDIRKGALGGKLPVLSRYSFFVFESMTNVMRSISATNWIFLADMNNYSLRKHSCLACIPFYLDLVTTYERHYPNTAKHVIAINTPRIFEAVSRLMIPLMSAETQKIFKIYGPDKAEWQKYLLQIFPAEQLTGQYGGTKKS